MRPREILQSWIFWLVLIVVVLFIVWLLAGGGQHRFIGLAPLSPDITDHSNNQDPSHTLSNLPYDSTYPIVSDAPYVWDRTKTDIPKSSFRPGLVLEKPCPATIGSSNQGLASNHSQLIKEPSGQLILRYKPHNEIEMARAAAELRRCQPPPIIGLIPNQSSGSEQVPIAEMTQTVSSKRSAAESRGEKICRQTLEGIYKRKFPSCRPDFLVNPESGRNLEIDGYCEELGIGFEYNGIQHYVYPNWIHRNHDEFVAQVRRDQYKINACDRAQVYLISIPYTVPHNRIYDYIVFYLPENVQKRLEAQDRGESIESCPPGLPDSCQ